MRKKVVKILSEFDAMAVENRVGDGTPDVYYIGGWIECKKTASFPKNPESKVALTHGLLMTQRVWLRRHFRKGGTCHVLTMVGNEFFLHAAEWAAVWLGAVDRETMTRYALLHCVGWPELTKRLPKYLHP